MPCLACRETLLQELPGKLWLDVLSKSDLLEADLAAADAVMHKMQKRGSILLETNRASGAPESLAAALGSDTDTLVQEAQSPQATRDHNGCSGHQQGSSEQALRDEPGQQGQSHNKVEDSAQDGESLQSNSLTPAAQAALLLSNAIRISSVTQSGIEQLQGAAMQMLSGAHNVKANDHEQLQSC